jgi:hypothetical protein
MQSTGDFHDEIVIHFLGIAEDIFDNVTAFDASNDMLNDNPYLRNEGVVRALLQSQLLSSRFLLWLERLDALRFVALKAGVFIQRAVLGKYGVFFISDLFIMTFTLISWTQIIDFARMESTNNEILDCMRFFLPL